VSQVPRDVLGAIEHWGPSINTFARRRYGISGQALLARLTQGESGFRKGAVSGAGARYLTQFMPGTREETIRKFGIDPWKSPDAAEHATVLHLLGKITGAKGLEGYNPGDPSYPSYILGQKVSGLGGRGTRAPGRLGGGGISSFALSPVKTTTQQTVSTPTVPSSEGLPTPAFSAQNELALPRSFGQIPSGGGPAPPSTVTTTTSTSGGGITGSQGAPAGMGGPNRARGQFVLDPGANRPGVNLAGDLKHFVSLVAGRFGRTLKIGTGTHHSRLTVDGNVSDHWDGHAVDIPVPIDSAKGDRIATAALITAGVPAAKARQMARQGGLFTLDHKGRRIQVIWKTNAGGNHHNHVHIGYR
jgi:hypothetical protein